LKTDSDTWHDIGLTHDFFLNKEINFKKLNLKKNKKIKNHKMTCGMIWVWHVYIFLKIKKLKNHKMTCVSYCSHSVNYFNDVNKNDQIK